MKLGVHIGYWGLGLSAEDQLALVQEAERLGYDSVWVAEAYGSDAPSVLGWLAHATHTIKLGAAVMQLPARPPALAIAIAARVHEHVPAQAAVDERCRGEHGGGIPPAPTLVEIVELQSGYPEHTGERTGIDCRVSMPEEPYDTIDVVDGQAGILDCHEARAGHQDGC